MVQQSIISAQDRSQLRRNFRKDLKGGVALTLFTRKGSVLTIPGRDCPYCPQTQQLMEELTALSPKLELKTVDFYQEPETAQACDIQRIPAVALDSAGAASPGSSGVKFYGIPSGHIMSVLVEDVMTISRGVSPLSNDTRRQLRRVDQPVNIQVFVTPTETSCTGLARLAHAVALECPQVSADVIEVQEYPALAQRYAVRSVPFTVINDQYRLAGPATEPQLLERILQAGVRPKET